MDEQNEVDVRIRRLKDGLPAVMDNIAARKFDDGVFEDPRLFEGRKQLSDLLTNSPNVIQALIDDRGYVIFRAKLLNYLLSEVGKVHAGKFTFSPYPPKQQRIKPDTTETTTESFVTEDNNASGKPEDRRIDYDREVNSSNTDQDGQQ